MEKDIKFWMLISELNSLTTILSIKCPEYQERVSKLKGELTEIISQGLEESKSPEFITLMWRIASKYNSTKFRKDYQTKELTNPLKNKYNKYLLPSN